MIRFSTLGVLPASIRALLEDFQRQSGNMIQVESIPWDTGWPTLLGFALRADGPHLSQIGSTWTPSLLALHALRAFSNAELRRLGSAEAFLPASWQAVQVPEKAVFALPWMAYIFLIVYRRSHLAKAGISEESAFVSSQAFFQTLQALKGKGFFFPLSIHTDPDGPHPLHILVSWVWEAGEPLLLGEKELNFAPVLQACERYFSMLQMFTPQSHPISLHEAEERFIRGEASVLICGAERPYIWRQARIVSQEMLDDLGGAPIPGVPWVGGTNLVIWKYTQLDPNLEQRTFQLLEFLVSPSTQQAIAANGFLPTRQEALAYLPDRESAITQAIVRALLQGRSYRPRALWGRIESSFRLTFKRIFKDISEGIEASQSVRFHLRSLAGQMRYLLPPKDMGRLSVGYL